MYIVHMKKTYTVARARQHLAQVLDEAEGGTDVVIERRGVRFTVRATSRVRPSKKASRIEIVDPAVEAGTWSWSWSDASGLGFSTPRGDDDTAS